MTLRDDNIDEVVLPPHITKETVLCKMVLWEGMDNW
jgi:hypothetical protein